MANIENAAAIQVDTRRRSGEHPSALRSGPRRLMAAVAAALLFGPVGIVALGSAFGVIPLPFEMHVLAERMPVIFSAHMATSAVALLLAPIVIAYRRAPRAHRKLGRVLGGFVVAGGLTALPVAIFSHSSDAARAGFLVQSLVWIGLFAWGFWAIRSGRISLHRTAMLAMVAVTTGAVWFRMMIGAAIAFGLPFEVVYATAAWIAWLAPLLLVLAFRKRLAMALG